MADSVQVQQSGGKIGPEDLDGFMIEIDGGKALESRPDEAEGKAPAAAEEIEESWGVAHGS